MEQCEETKTIEHNLTIQECGMVLQDVLRSTESDPPIQILKKKDTIYSYNFPCFEWK